MATQDRIRRSTNSSWPTSIAAVIIVAAIIVIGLQVLTTWQNTQHVAEIFEKIKNIEQEELLNEKTKSEIIKIRVESELRGFFWHSLISGLLPLVTAFVAVVTAWIGLRKYLDTREKERIDRAAEDLRSSLNQLASKEPLERNVGVVSLQHFFTPDKREYHLRAISALVAAARLEKDSEVTRSIRLGVEQAVRCVDADILRGVSWQGVQLTNADFKSLMLAGIDFRDADLENADFSNCNLTEARFTNASLKGARIDEATLVNTDLAYVDFAGASMQNTKLDNANFNHARVLNLDLRGADLRKTEFDTDEFPWELTKHWREAILESTVREQLIQRYGLKPTGAVILMLMWEVPPLIAGGTWTACYHFVRNLRQQGANLKIVVPWEQAKLMPAPFGREVKIIPLGIRIPEHTVSAYGEAHGPSPYGQSGWNPAWSSPYSFAGSYGAPSTFRSPYAASVSPYGGLIYQGLSYGQGPTLLGLTEEFKQRILYLVRSEQFDLIHAHDWVTFPAARAVSSAYKKPWVAHFHSLETDRRHREPDAIIERIEKGAVKGAESLVTPSKVTREKLKKLYNASGDKIKVVPNSLSSSQVIPSGEFETKRVVFLGRLTEQKGLDRFVNVASKVRRADPTISFVAYGSGEMGGLYRYQSEIALLGPLDWHNREKAFRGASVALVPSRSEPFGMVVMEAMLHQVPVLYPEDSGVAEVMDAGIKVDTNNIEAMAEEIQRLLKDWDYWIRVVEKQTKDIIHYGERKFEKNVLMLWSELSEDEHSKQHP